MPKQRSRSRERGVSLMLAGLSLTFIVPAVGLMIDVSVLYSVQARFQSAVDGAALAAARALNLGQSTSAQAAAAQSNAVNWFYANFPTGSWGTTGTNMSTGTVSVFDDPNNAHVRNVTVTATTSVPTYFMAWFGAASTTLSATGNASRRDVVVMMVLDRSGSMGAACASMLTAAKLFTGQFAAGRDQIGLVSFSDNVYIHSSPTTTFQTVLGYKNNLGSGTGAIDTIVCSGGTSTAQAISVAYNELYKVNLPGALNVIMFETDGLPNTLTLNFWDSSSSKTALTSTSTCTDKNSKKLSQGGFASSAVLPSWTAGETLAAGSYFSSIPAGMVGGVYGDDPNGTNKFYILFKYWATSTANSFGSSSFATASGCAFNSSGGQNPSPPPSDIAWFPVKDVWGNQLSPGYLPVTLTGGKVVSNSWQSYHNAALNAADNAAYQARTNSTLPAYFFGIGLGGTSTNPPDYVLMQRIANDPNGDNYNSPPLYSACSSEANCTTYSTQPQGTFIFSANTASLSQAFLSISSEVLRLSK
ncbi:MAG TPA: VWA domain-containing protein [Bryobacteraceae bacterium]|nr:VWA domain-containing protein [Bryobacteraceae bacterium]